MEIKLINDSDIKVGDEIVCSCHSSLRYYKVLRVPKSGGRYFKVSVGSEQFGTTYKWISRKFESDVSKHNDTMYLSLCSRDILLIKRENEF